MKYNEKYGLWCDEDGNIYKKDNRYKGNELCKMKYLLHHGYYKVHTPLSHGHKIVYVHRIIAETFIDEIPNNMQVDHIDRNRTNNSVSNLRIVTPKENCLNRGVNKCA